MWDKIKAFFQGKKEKVSPMAEVPPKEEPKEKRKPPAWYLFALKFKGKKETDPEFSKYMVPQWKLFGINLNTIAQSWAAWCGLAMAVALASVGIDYQHNGQLARNWSTYGREIRWQIDGIPQGAIVQINHVKCGSGSSNHVSQANGYCTAKDLLKPGATIDLYGGNQGNTWQVSTYSVKEICAVRWPNGVEMPPPVTESENCASRKVSGGSTR